MRRVEFEDGLELTLRFGGTPTLEQRQTLAVLAVGSGWAVLAQKTTRLAFGNGAHELVHHDPVLEEFYIGNAPDAEVFGEFRVLFRVDFGQQEIPSEFVGEAFQDGAQNPAWPAPGRPEINGHGTLERFVNYRLLEVGELHISHVNGCRHSKTPFHQLTIYDLRLTIEKSRLNVSRTGYKSIINLHSTTINLQSSIVNRQSAEVHTHAMLRPQRYERLHHHWMSRNKPHAPLLRQSSHNQHSFEPCERFSNTNPRTSAEREVGKLGTSRLSFRRPTFRIEPVGIREEARVMMHHKLAHQDNRPLRQEVIINSVGGHGAAADGPGRWIKTHGLGKDHFGIAQPGNMVEGWKLPGQHGVE